MCRRDPRFGTVLLLGDTPRAFRTHGHTPSGKFSRARGNLKNPDFASFWAEISGLLRFKSIKLWGFQISASRRKFSRWRVTIIPKTPRGMTKNSSCAKSWVQTLHTLLQICKSPEPANTSKWAGFELDWACFDCKKRSFWGICWFRTFANLQQSM